jgi:hypothetical protein
VAGVTNPLFENHPEWWDILCNVDTGRIRISPQIPPVTQDVPELFPVPPSTDPTGDITFMEEIHHLIQNRISEAFIRNRFKDWLWRFIRKAGVYEELVYGETIVGLETEENFIIPGHGLVWTDETTKMKEIASSQMRFEGWRGGVSWNYLAKVSPFFRETDMQDREMIFSTDIIKTMDIHHQLDRLRISKNLSQDDTAMIYLALNSEFKSYDQLNLVWLESGLTKLLSALPLSHGGLTPIAIGLFHTYEKVRLATAEILERINEHPVPPFRL